MIYEFKMATSADFERELMSLQINGNTCTVSDIMMDYEFLDFETDERSMLQGSMMTEGSYDLDEEEMDARSESSGKRDSLNLNSLDCWDYTIELECLTGTEDLQLAAELGKNLLARNKELENSVKQCHNIIEEQAQEIEYLSKQTTALRKTNDNRIRIYEQLEVSIQELERANQRLALDNSTDKKQIKSLCAYRDTLEARCEELQKALDEAKLQQKDKSTPSLRTSAGKEGDDAGRKAEDESGTTHHGKGGGSKEDIVNDLLVQNQELKRQKSRDQRKMTDLEEEIRRINQDMALLEEELSTLYQREEYIKNLQEEVSALEEVRSGNLCGRCMKEMDLKMQQVQMMLDPEEEEEERSVCNASTGPQTDTKEDNPYKTLVQKYEALLEEQSRNRRHCHRSSSGNCMSLQDELKPFGNMNSFQGGVEHDEESSHEDAESKEQRSEEKRKVGKRKAFSNTPTDFSEAETSSSGFSDETSNKATQTERNFAPGSFLCSIADGEDCIFSIYDDACPIESRFRKTPEYRTLFREIFAVLKRAAEAKDDGEQLPLLDDITPITEIPKVPPVTPAKEEVPVSFDDVQSVADSAATSEAATEESQDAAPEAKSKQQKASPSKGKKSNDEMLQFLSLGVMVNKKAHRKSNNSPGRRGRGGEHAEDGEGTPRNSPRRSGRRRKEWRNYDSPRTQSPAIRPHVLTTLERRESRGANSLQKGERAWDFQPFVSTAAQEVAKLKNLDKTYAEVLRQPPKTFNRVLRKGSSSPLQ